MAATASVDTRRAFPATGGPPEHAPILARLTVTDRVRLAIEVLGTYCEVRWRLWRSGLEATTKALRGRAREGEWLEPGLESRWQGVRLAKAVTRTLKLVPADSRCLMQSLVLTGLLSRRGIDSLLVIGVKSAPDFEAHAWVEHGERPLLPTGDHARLVEL